MKKSVFILLTALFSGLMVFGQPGTGKGKGMGQGPCSKGSAMMPAEKMIPDLTDSQKEKIKDLKVALLNETRPIQNQMRELGASYHTLITADNPDVAAIEKNIEKRSALRTSLMKSHAHFRVAVSELLTEDQRAVFNSPHQGRGRMMRQPGTCPYREPVI